MISNPPPEAAMKCSRKVVSSWLPVKILTFVMFYIPNEFSDFNTLVKGETYLGPFLNAVFVVLNVVQIDIREEFQPSVVGMSGSVFHVAAESNLEHFERLIANRIQIFLIHYSSD